MMRIGTALAVLGLVANGRALADGDTSRTTTTTERKTDGDGAKTSVETKRTNTTTTRKTDGDGVKTTMETRSKSDGAAGETTRDERFTIEKHATPEGEVARGARRIDLDPSAERRRVGHPHWAPAG